MNLITLTIIPMRQSLVLDSISTHGFGGFLCLWIGLSIMKTINVNGQDITCYKTGEIEKIHRQRGHAVRTFGSKTRYGYMRTQAGGKYMMVHRLIAQAFLLDWNKCLDVDHIDGDRQNNAINNLRMATRAQNTRGYNKKRTGVSSQYRGVCWNKRFRKWEAYLKINGKQIGVGRFDDEEEAARARDAVADANGYPAEGLNFRKEDK